MRPNNYEVLSFEQENAFNKFCREDADGFGLPSDPSAYIIVVKRSSVYVVVPGNDYSDLVWQNKEWIPL